jgi:hypothetical protein
MTHQDIKNYYKTGVNFAAKTGMCVKSYNNWKRWGFVPIKAQIKLHRLTKGVLKIDIEFIEPITD